MTRYPPEFYIGVDLGQRRDPSAIAVVHRYEEKMGWNAYLVSYDYEWRNALRLLERLPLGTPYPEVVARVKEIVKRAALDGKVTLVVDATGVGAPVVDMLRAESLPCDLVGVCLTGGEHATRAPGGFNVPKFELVVGLQLKFQKGEVLIAGSLGLAKPLVEELVNIGWDLRAQGSGHDDLAMAVALACWRMDRPTIGEKGDGRLV